MGHTYTYVSKAGIKFNKEGLYDEVRGSLTGLKGFIDIRTSLKGKDGSFRLYVIYDGYKVFSITINGPVLVDKKESEVQPVVVPKKKMPQIALVLDDFGYSGKNLDRIKKLGVPLTLAVLPNLKYTDEVCSFAENNGIDTILHFPMEPLKESTALEENTILVSMPDDKITGILLAALGSVYNAKGLNNHMGSKATQDMRVMKTVFTELKKRDMFFMDSYTVAGSICSQAAEEVGIDFSVRDVFLDHAMEEEKIRENMSKAFNVAMKKGKAIAIGHDRSVTIDVLAKVIPVMKRKGVRFVKLADLIEKKL